jgi:hypothetical protein
MDAQRHVRTKHFFVWERDDSVTSRGRRGLSRTRQILRRNFEGTLKETSKYTSKFFGKSFLIFSFFGLSSLNIAYRRISNIRSCIFEYSNLFELFELSRCSKRDLLERLLKRIIDNGKHETLMPQALHNTQKEYKDYPLTVFRKHIYQEVAQRKAMAENKKNKSKRNEIALWILKIGWRLEDACCDPSNIAAS